MTKQLKERIEELGLIQINNDFLCSLYFPCIDHRYEAIPKNYVNTFKWIYDIPHFRDWMERGSGIFWIHGKPGAGKSTLMKFLAGNPQTKAHLDVWAAPRKAIIAAHYFWHLGSPMQKSMRGLLQTLASEILHKAPRLIPLARRLQATTSSDTESSKLDIQVDHGSFNKWTMDELSKILRGVAQGDTGDIKLYLFVDGLDEFEGDHQEVCEILSSLATSQHIKLCVSSRPWNVFKDQFGQDCTKHLAVHELTASDMETFVQGELNAHRNWKTNRTSAAERASLVRDIRTRANGVFLWVTLVTQSLCRGLTNHDNIHDLKRRLQILPTDLGDLFKHILHRIDPVYMHKSAELLQIALHDGSSAKLPPEAYYYHERDFERDDPAVMWPVGKLSLEELSWIRELAGRRITALTGGLLEPRFHDDGEPTVEFLHRSVGDFLGAEDIERDICSRTRPNFDVHLALTKLNAMLITSTTYPRSARIRIVVGKYIPEVFKGHNTRLAYGFLDEIKHHITSCRIPIYDLRNFMFTLLNSSLFEYVSEELSRNSKCFSDVNIDPEDILRDADDGSTASIMLRTIISHQ
jgi:adenylate kinase family enzyme